MQRARRLLTGPLCLVDSTGASNSRPQGPRDMRPRLRAVECHVDGLRLASRNPGSSILLFSTKYVRARRCLTGPFVFAAASRGSNSRPRGFVWTRRRACARLRASRTGGASRAPTTGVRSSSSPPNAKGPSFVGGPFVFGGLDRSIELPTAGSTGYETAPARGFVPQSRSGRLRPAVRRGTSTCRSAAERTSRRGACSRV